jgi:hypothetical protein
MQMDFISTIVIDMVFTYITSPQYNIIILL